jgi:hypothetical protein
VMDLPSTSAICAAASHDHLTLTEVAAGRALCAVQLA